MKIINWFRNNEGKIWTFWVITLVTSLTLFILFDFFDVAHFVILAIFWFVFFPLERYNKRLLKKELEELLKRDIGDGLYG